MTENVINDVLLKECVNGILRLKSDLDSERGVYMSKCKTLREQISAYKDRAKDGGVPRKVISATIEKIDLEKQLEALTDGLDDDAIEIFEYVQEKLGAFADTPLGQAAVDALKESGAGEKPSAAVVPIKRGPGRPRKEQKADALNSLIADPDEAAARAASAPANDDDGDLRPQFLKDKDTEAAERNAALLTAGISELGETA